MPEPVANLFAAYPFDVDPDDPAVFDAAAPDAAVSDAVVPVTGQSPPRRRAGIVPPRADKREVAAIFVGGAIGTALRAALSVGFPHAPTAWPWPTFGVNIGAAFLLGYAATRLQERLPLSAYRRPLIGTGVCGGLSTFSTMQVEILKMLSAHAYALAAWYILASVAAGYAAIHLATSMVRRVRVRR